MLKVFKQACLRNEKNHMNIKNLTLFVKTIVSVALMTASVSFAAPSYTLQQVIDVTFSEHPSIRVAKAQEAAALASVTDRAAKQLQLKSQ